MAWYDFFWTYEEDGNAGHVAEHGLTTEDVEHAVRHAWGRDVSASSGERILFGPALDGGELCVVYELLDEITCYVITAYRTDA